MKQNFISKMDLQIITSVLAGALFLFALPAHTSHIEDDTTQVTSKLLVTTGYDKTYSFSDIKAQSQSNTILVSGRVKSAGKQLRGHIDIAVFDSTGKLNKKLSVKPYFNNRPGIGTRNTTGFPFRARIQFSGVTAIHPYTIRLALHRDWEHMDTVYECGVNKAVHE